MLQTYVSPSGIKSCTSRAVNDGHKHMLGLLFYNLQNSHKKTSEVQAILRECGKFAAIDEGKQTHCIIWKHGFHLHNNLMTSLLDMYSKCTSINQARQVFDEMHERDVVATNGMISGFCRFQLFSEAIELFNSMPKRDVGSWNSLISGLGQNAEGRTSLIFFDRMRAEGVSVDFVTMLSVLSVCANLAALVNGKMVHGLVIKYGFNLCLPVGNAIIDMYAKSGRVDDACLFFENMPSKNVVSWTCLIVGFGKHGLGYKAIGAFDRMEMESTIVPNKITFLGTLYACSHAGLVQQGWRIYSTMIHKYLIKPMMEHYTSMVDLLARAGHLNEARKFIEMMPVKPDAKLLTALLSSCCSHKNVELAKSIGCKLLELDEPKEAGAYMLLSNLYGLVGDLEGVTKVRKLMLDMGIRKEKASTWIELNRTVHRFESSDRTHPRWNHIYGYLETLIGKMKRNGYLPNTSMVMQNVEEKMKEDIVLHHSEKLAIVFGLISTPAGATVTIVKNLRMCVDCHAFTCFVSKIEQREIVARDSNRFHHFKDGICSCLNQW